MQMTRVKIHIVLLFVWDLSLRKRLRPATYGVPSLVFINLYMRISRCFALNRVFGSTEVRFLFHRDASS